MVKAVNAISGNTILIFNLVMIVLGLYLIYSTWNMKKTGVIPNLFIAAEDSRKIKNKKGFIDHVYMPQMILAAVFIVLGLLDVFFEYVIPFRYYGYIELVVFLFVFFYYGMKFKEARDKFISQF